VGSHRRALLLPDSLRRREVRAASLRDGRLRVTFADGADEADGVAAAATARGAR